MLITVTFHHPEGGDAKQVTINPDASVDTHYSTLSKNEVSVLSNLSSIVNEYSNFLRQKWAEDVQNEADPNPKEKVN